jgi:hypothetical protein
MVDRPIAMAILAVAAAFLAVRIVYYLLRRRSPAAG